MLRDTNKRLVKQTIASSRYVVDILMYNFISVIRSWNLFLMTTGVVPLLTGVAFAFMPESPKFLMSRGRNEEAMKIFRWIYYMNTGNSGDDYPVR